MAALLFAGTAASAQGVAPAIPAPAPAPMLPPMAQSFQPAALPSASAVAAFYKMHRIAPMWFRGSVASPAAQRLVGILKRAHLDGLAMGPQLAAQVETAIARAATGKPADVMASEQMVAAAWVLYVQA
ncbi:MAG TPA: hypothetical protein VGB39_07595, partial [Sphingomicrobium sp.]